MRKIAIQAKTIGESIDQLANAFSEKADINGLYILEQALEKAREIRSQEQRSEELAEILEAHKKRTEERRELSQAKD